MAPCPPLLNGYSVCEEGYNHTRWYYEGEPECAEDVAGYILYYSPTVTGDLVEIARFESATDTSYQHVTGSTLAGIYYVSAIDSVGNISGFSNRLALDECSNYRLPNVFSPNNDGINDIYRSLRTSYIERVDMQIFNRWGLLVFQTDDPDINWDGKIMGTDRLVSTGVYYYVCTVIEQRLTGPEERYLQDFIYVYSGEENDPQIIDTK